MLPQRSFRNIAFSSVIGINGRQYEFNFRQQPAETTIYHTDVTDAKGERIMFTMVFENDTWKAVGALLPAWIEQHAARIGEVIVQHVNH